MSQSQRSLEEQIVEGVLRRLGRADAEVARCGTRGFKQFRALQVLLNGW